MKRWTTQEVEELKRLYASHTLPELSERFGRSRSAVALKCCRLGLRELHLKTIKLMEWKDFARRLGLEKTPEFMKECQAHTARKAKESHLRNGTYPAKGWYSPNLKKGERYQFKRNINTSFFNPQQQ